MPGPTTRGTYIGKTKAETIALARQRAASTLPHDHPACRICGRPMVTGQAASNGGAHYTCTPQDPEWQASGGRPAAPATTNQPATATQTALSTPETGSAYPTGSEPGNGRTA